MPASQGIEQAVPLAAALVVLACLAVRVTPLRSPDVVDGDRAGADRVSGPAPDL